MRKFAISENTSLKQHTDRLIQQQTMIRETYVLFFHLVMEFVVECVPVE